METDSWLRSPLRHFAEREQANSNKDSSHPRRSSIPNNKTLESGTCQNMYFPIFLAYNLERLPKLQ